MIEQRQSSYMQKKSNSSSTSMQVRNQLGSSCHESEVTTRLQNIEHRQEGFQNSLNQISDSIQDILKLVSGTVISSKSNVSAINSGTFLKQFKEQNDTMVTLKEMVDLAALKVWPELIKVEFKQLIELKLVTL
jgi:hypothetical protein